MLSRSDPQARLCSPPHVFASSEEGVDAQPREDQEQRRRTLISPQFASSVTVRRDTATTVRLWRRTPADHRTSEPLAGRALASPWLTDTATTPSAIWLDRPQGRPPEPIVIEDDSPTRPREVVIDAAWTCESTRTAIRPVALPIDGPFPPVAVGPLPTDCAQAPPKSPSGVRTMPRIAACT